MKSKHLKVLKISIITILSILIILFLLRLLSPKQIDDISSEIPCEQNLIKKSDILWIIPKFNNIPISENPEWCEYILSLNKTLGLHGVTHEYQEFSTNRNQKYLEEGIQIFEDCFGYKPTLFKPPQLKISKENKKLIKNNNLQLKLITNQITHKVYHCNNTGFFPNWFIDFF